MTLESLILSAIVTLMAVIASGIIFTELYL